MMLILRKYSSKKIISVVLIVAVLAFNCSKICCFAHGRQEHDSILDNILFGMDSGFPSTWIEGINALHSASYLALDQYSGSGQEDLVLLRNYHVPGIPRQISVIDFPGNYTHRQYTHMGWNHIYNDDRAHWSVRKRILINTVGKVFNFSRSVNFSEFNLEYSPRAESMAAFIYYIHVLGDYQEYFSSYPHQRDELQYMMPIASGTLDTPSVISEIEDYLNDIFVDQVNTYSFNGLKSKLDDCDSHLYTIISTSSGYLTDEEYEELCDYTDEVIDALEQYVPNLLRNESFFDDTFPLSESDSSSAWSWLPWNKHT